MRDIAIQSGKSLSHSLTLKPSPEKPLFCSCCANDKAKSIENLRGVKVDVLPVVLLCAAGHCANPLCDLRTGLLYEIRAARA